MKAFFNQLSNNERTTLAAMAKHFYKTGMAGYFRNMYRFAALRHNRDYLFYQGKYRTLICT